MQGPKCLLRLFSGNLPAMFWTITVIRIWGLIVKFLLRYTGIGLFVQPGLFKVLIVSSFIFWCEKIDAKLKVHQNFYNFSTFWQNISLFRVLMLLLCVFFPTKLWLIIFLTIHQGQTMKNILNSTLFFHLFNYLT